MEFKYEPHFEVSKSVESLDRRRNELNFLIGVYTDELLHKNPSPSLVTGEEISRCARSLLKSCTNGKTFSGLDAIVVQDIRENAKKAMVTYDYFFTGKIEKVVDFLSGIFGKGAFFQLLSAVSPGKFDHQAVHDYFIARRREMLGTIDAELVFDEDEFKSEKRKVIKVVESYKDDAEKFLGYLDIGNKLPEYSLVTSPYDFSFWDFESRIMAIERDLVPCIKMPNGRVALKTSVGLITQLHEAIHFANEELSKKCLPAVCPERGSYENLVHGACAEGVALYSEDLALEWIKRESKTLMVEDELEFLSAFKKAYLPNKLIRITSAILDIKDCQERLRKDLKEHQKTESDAELAKITGFAGFGKERYIFPPQTLIEATFNANYFFGDRRIRDIACKAKRKFNLNSSSSATKGLLLQALMTGIWVSPEAQEKFVMKHFFPKAKEDKII